MGSAARPRVQLPAAAVLAAMLACRAASSGSEQASATARTDVELDAARDQPRGGEPAEPATRADAAGRADTAPTELSPGPAASPEPGVAAPPEPAPDSPAPPESEPGVAAPPEPAAGPEPKPSTKACRRPGPRASGALRDLVGLDQAAIRRCLGAPDRTSGSTWHYVWPKGCAYEVTRVVVRFSSGVVASASAKHEITGKHCGSEL